MEAIDWLSEMSRRLEKRIPDREARLEFLRAVHYEATRAGLDPQLVLGLIQVESGFKKYAVSTAGARGFMQVMPFWVKVVGRSDDNLFHLRTNLRYGCTILRHYLDIERGDLYRALGRYNGSLGQPQYPNLVRGAWQNHWSYTKRNLAMRHADTTAPAQRIPGNMPLMPRISCPMPPRENCFIIFCVCSNCLSRRLTSCTCTPAPSAIRRLRVALSNSGWLRSAASSS
jgi:soluble lytic murein transglycosylase-like protein